MKFFRWFLMLVTLAGLAVDAYVHLKLAGSYPSNRGSITEPFLFRAEAVLAIAAALFLLVHSSRWSASLAALVAAGGLGALLLYRYVDVGAVGPLPNMYEPFWFTDKTWCAVAQGLATVAAAALAITSSTAASSGPSRKIRATSAHSR